MRHILGITCGAIDAERLTPRLTALLKVLIVHALTLRRFAMIETKVSVGSFTGILTGLVTWALVAYIPAFRTGLPAPVSALIPVAVAWLAHSVAAYMAPHTPRPVPVPPPPPSLSVTPPPASAA